VLFQGIIALRRAKRRNMEPGTELTTLPSARELWKQGDFGGAMEEYYPLVN